MKAFLLLAFSACAALGMPAQKTVYFNPDTVATDVSVWQAGKNIIPPDFPDLLYDEYFNGAEEIWLGWNHKPVQVGVTAKGEPVTVVYNHVTHQREIYVGDRLLFADNEVSFAVPGDKHEDPLTPAAVNCNKTEVGYGDRTTILNTTDRDFETKLLKFVAPAEGFTREGYCYYLGYIPEPEDSLDTGGKSFVAYTMELPSDPKLRRSVLNILGKYYVPHTEETYYSMEGADESFSYSTTTYTSNREPRDFRDAISMMEAAAMVSIPHYRPWPSDTIPLSWATRSTKQFTPVYHKGDVLTYKVSFSDTYYVGGGFASGVSYVSFDTKKDEIMTTRDIFPNTTDSLKLKETYLEAVMKFMESRMDSLEEYYPQEKRRQTVLDFLKDGYFAENTGATVDDITIPEHAAITNEGVRILLPASVFSDFGETPDAYILLPWKSLKGLTPFVR